MIASLIIAAAMLQTPVIVIEHNYGTTVTEGALIQLDYQPGSILIEFAADGIFKGGFE